MEKKDFTERLWEQLEGHKVNVEDTCTAVWGLIQRQADSDKEQYFRCFLNEIDLLDFTFENDIEVAITNKESLFDKINNLEKQIVGTLTKENPTEELFYHSVWEKINDPLLFSDNPSQIAFLMSLWTDPRIPYFHLEAGCSMENEEYQKISRSISQQIKKARFILCTSIQQKTQRASLIMSIADSILDEREKTVFWAKILTYPGSPPNISAIVEKIKDALIEQGIIGIDKDGEK